MTRQELFKRIIEEIEVIDPVIWLLRIQFSKVDEDHEQYIRAMAARHKDNPKVMKNLQEHIEFWKIE
jgi:hypothetical protein